jgi:hypothetical protein
MKSSEYRISQEQHGRAGWLDYAEGSRLRFPWEILGTGGIAIRVPSPEDWDEFCEAQQADWAKERRREILERVGERFVKMRYGRGDFNVESLWVVVKPGSSFLSRIFHGR